MLPRQEIKSALQPGFDDAKTAAESILRHCAARPRIGLVLGSGLGKLGDEVANSVAVPYSQIPGFPVSTAIGHAGELVIGSLRGVPIVVMKGRAHLYEGYNAQQVVLPVRVMKLLGIHTLIVTNAAGAINTSYSQGSLVLMSDHINLQGQNPLIGPNDERLGTRFPDMTEAYSKKLRELAKAVAARLGIPLLQGVYAALAGPSYETPAEIRFLRTIGADMVGMSTALEVIAARHIGLRVLGISCVTNVAAGILDQPINHEEVLEVANRVQGDFLALLRELIPRIESEPPEEG